MQTGEPREGGSQSGAGADLSSPPSPPPIPVAPPTVRRSLPPRRPSWPTTIGVLGLILGLLGFVWSAWALAAPYLITANLAQHTTAAYAGVFSDGFSAALNIIANGLSLIVSGLLMTGAILILQWRRRGVPVLRIYAVGAVVNTVIAIAIMVITLPAVVEASAQGGPNPGVISGVILAVVLTALFGFGPPVFILYWFSRSQVKADLARYFRGAPAPR